MKIVVFIKQVPDTTDVKIDPETNTLKRGDSPAIINPFDLYALEEGIRLKEKFGGEVIAITMGPPQAKEAIKEAVAMGVDDGILISDRAFAGADTLATSYTLSQAVKKIENVDLIICGKQASDGDTAQTGPGIAEWLKLPQATFVKKIDDIKEGHIYLESMWDEGTEKLKLPLPALITVVKEINEPRIPGLRGKMKAKKFEVKLWDNKFLSLPEEKIGLNGSPTQVRKIFSPPQKEPGRQLTVTENVSEIAEEVVNTFQKMGLV